MQTLEPVDQCTRAMEAHGLEELTGCVKRLSREFFGKGIRNNSHQPGLWCRYRRIHQNFQIADASKLVSGKVRFHARVFIMKEVVYFLTYPYN